MGNVLGGRDDPARAPMGLSKVDPSLRTRDNGQSTTRILTRRAPHTTSRTAMASTTSLVRWAKKRKAEIRRLRGFRGRLL